MSSKTLLTLLLALVCALPCAVVASLPLWERNLGAVGMGTTTALMSTDGTVLYTLWSCNAWSSRPSYFLLALDTNTGAMKWNGTLFGAYTLGLYASMAQDAQNVYVTSIYTGIIVALDKERGTQLWNATPFQSLRAYGVASVSPQVIITSNDYTELLLNSSSGDVLSPNPNQPNSMASVTPFVVTLDTAVLVFMGARCYELQANNSLTLLWQFPSTTFPAFLTASPQIAVIPDQAGSGVPRLNAVDTFTGAFIWQTSTYNTQSTFQWARVVNGRDVVALFGQAVQYYNATGGLVWQQSFDNITGNPVLDPTGTFVVVPLAYGSGFAASVLHLSSGVTTQTVVIADTYDQFYQQAQLFVGASVVAASITNGMATPSYQTLVAQSLTPKPPVGVVVHTYTSVDCSGAYVAATLQTGCTGPLDGNDAVSRTCSGNTVAIASGSTCSSLGPAENFSLQACIGGLDSSFRILSCN